MLIMINFFLFWSRSILNSGWLIHEYPKLYNFQDFVIAQFALLFALFALGGSSVGAIDKKEADDSAKRIFHLVNHKCDIDPLSGSGKKLD